MKIQQNCLIIKTGFKGTPWAALFPDQSSFLFATKEHATEYARKMQPSFDPDLPPGDQAQFYAGLVRDLVECEMNAPAQEVKQNAPNLCPHVETDERMVEL